MEFREADWGAGLGQLVAEPFEYSENLALIPTRAQEAQELKGLALSLT
jgi:hypothetical protein